MLLTRRRSSELRGHRTLRARQKPNHFSTAMTTMTTMFPEASRQFPCYSLRNKEVFVSAPGGWGCRRQRKRDVPMTIRPCSGARRWCGRVQAWPRSMASPPPRPATACTLSQALSSLLLPAAKTQMEAATASPQAKILGRHRFGSCVHTRALPQLAASILC